MFQMRGRSVFMFYYCLLLVTVVRTRAIILFKRNIEDSLLRIYGPTGFWLGVFKVCSPEWAGGSQGGAGRQGIVRAGLLLAAVDCANGQAAVASHTVAPLRSGLAAALQQQHTSQDYTVRVFTRSVRST